MDSTILSGRSGSVRWFAGKTIILLLLFGSLAIHCVLLGAVWVEWVTVQGFRTEFAVVVMLSLSVDAVLYGARRPTVFRYLVLVRLALAMIGTRMLGSENVLLSVLFGATVVDEIAVFDSGTARDLVMGATCSALVATAARGVVFMPLPTRVVFICAYVISIAFTVSAVYLIDEYRESLADYVAECAACQETVSTLANANHALQAYADNIQDESADRERHRVAAELHDAVGYALTNVAVMMKAARIQLVEDPESVSRMLEQVEQQSIEALGDARRILHRMHAVARPTPQGYRAIFSLAKAFEGATGVRVDVHRGNLPMSLGQRLDRILYRIAQEALTNAFRHGQATHIEMLFWRSDEAIRMVVKDNGRGAVAHNPNHHGIGLEGIRERLASVGGVLSTTAAREGFELSINVPFGIGRLGGNDQGPDR